MDFGVAFRLDVTKFGFQARPGFSDRLAGVQVFGSEDRENWIRLTEHEAAFTQAYQEIPVRGEFQNLPVRYLMIRKTTEYPDALRGSFHGLLEFSVLRIFGERRESDGTGSIPIP